MILSWFSFKKPINLFYCFGVHFYSSVKNVNYYFAVVLVKRMVYIHNNFVILSLLCKINPMFEWFNVFGESYHSVYFGQQKTIQLLLYLWVCPRKFNHLSAYTDLFLMTFKRKSIYTRWVINVTRRDNIPYQSLHNPFWFSFTQNYFM